MTRSNSDGNPSQPSHNYSPFPVDMGESPFSWRNNLIYVWFSQFFSIMGFGFGLPFSAYYVQELGITDSDGIKFWTSAFQATAPLTLAVFGPIWGIIGDKYGRRKMMLRANCGAALVVCLMGIAPNVYWLIFFRLCQGMFTGTAAAAQTLVSASTPESKNGVALGVLSTAVSGGFMAGQFLGGLCADEFGYGNSFLVGSLILLISTLFVLFGVKEKFIPPEPSLCHRIDKDDNSSGNIMLGLPLLILIFAVSLARRIDQPLLPLLVQHMHGSTNGAGLIMGGMGAISSVALIFSGLILGKLIDKYPPGSVAKICAIAGGMSVAVMGFANGLIMLYVTRFMMMFFAGGLDPVFQVWLGRSTSKEKRGAVFGWAVTFKSAGWVVAPAICYLLSGLFDHGLFEGNAFLERFDLRIGFFAEAVSFIVIAVLIGWVARKMLSIGGGESAESVVAGE